MFDSVDMKLKNINGIHKNEILGLEYSPIDDFRDSRHSLIATSSKDHSVKILDAQSDYDEILHIQDHSSAVIGVKLVEEDKDTNIHIVSADVKGNLNVRALDEELKLTEPSIRDFPGNKIFSIGKTENNIVLGMDKKVQVVQVNSNNSLSLTKHTRPSSAVERDYIKLENDD